MSKIMTRLVSSYLFTKWNTDMRQSHPCPICKDENSPCWLGKICEKCQKTFSIQCPCPEPISGIIDEDYCQRCGYIILMRGEDNAR